MTRDNELWNRILVRIAEKISAGCFDTWFRPVTSAGCEDNTLHLSVPTETFRQSLIDNYANVLHEAVADVVGSDITVEITTGADASDPGTCKTTGSETIVPLPVVQASALEVPLVRHTWLVDQLWADRAVGVIGGGPKLGKSWLALDMAVSIASGTPCLDTFKVHVSGPVLLYAAEDSAAALRSRLETLTRIRQLDFESLDVRVITAESLRLDRAEDQGRLEATVALHRPVMLILDPLVRVHAIDENVAGQVAALLGYLRALQRKNGVAIGLVHHVRKNVSSATGAGYSLRGSGDLYAWLDSFLYLRKNHDQLTLSAEHRSAPGAGPFILELVKPDTDSGTHLKLVAAGSINTSPKSDALTDRVLQLLSGRMEPMTVDAMRQQLQVRNQRVIEALRQLSSQGAVQKLPHGYAAITRLP
jgi:hypothetical protein